MDRAKMRKTELVWSIIGWECFESTLRWERIFSRFIFLDASWYVPLMLAVLAADLFRQQHIFDFVFEKNHKQQAAVVFFPSSSALAAKYIERNR